MSFEIGDRIMCDADGVMGNITGIAYYEDRPWQKWHVRWDDDIETDESEDSILWIGDPNDILKRML